MKNMTKLLLVLLAVLTCCTAVFAEDTHYTCSSEVSDFDGKTFENLYLDVEGCGASLEFADLTVTGNLIYDGGRDTEDHYITFTRPSIESMYAPCEPTHECHFIFNPKDHDVVNEYVYVVNEMTLLPSGNEKGKIFVKGNGEQKPVKELDGHVYSNTEIFMTEIKRLNFIIGEWNADVVNSLLHTENVPDMPSYTSAEGDIEIDLGSITVEEMSVVNTNQKAVSSLSLRNMAKVNLLAAYTPSLKIYEPEKTEQYQPGVFTLVSALSGNSLDLSIDHAWVEVAHILGGNNSSSVLKLKSGFEKMHSNDFEVITNLFLFGANMEFSGYNAPDRDTMTLRRLVITEQPSDYQLDASPSILNDFLDKYGDSYMAYEKYLDPNDYEELLDQNWVFQRRSVRLISELSQKYAINYPGSETHWKPNVKLSYVNVGKAVCAQSIADEVPALSMFQLNTDSYMYMKKDVMRYVMPEGLTKSLADYPRIYTGFEPLPGCHTYGLDQYGNWVVKD